MSPGINTSSDMSSEDPYAVLGLAHGASFDSIQEAKKKKINEAAGDAKSIARIEACYDALLMESLKDRQLGKISSAAENASQKEEKTLETGSGSLITRLKNLNSESVSGPVKRLWPTLVLPDGQGLIIRLLLGFLALLLLLVSSSDNSELILSFSTIGVFISQSRRGRRILPSLGWSVVLLSTGLIIGGFLANGTSSDPSFATIISSAQLEALPALLLLWAGALFLE